MNFDFLKWMPLPTSHFSFEDNGNINIAFVVVKNFEWTENMKVYNIQDTLAKCLKYDNLKDRITCLKYELKEFSNEVPPYCIGNFVGDINDEIRFLEDEIRYRKRNNLDLNIKIIEPEPETQTAQPETEPQKTKEIEKIQWNGTEAQIVYLFSLLVDNHLIATIQCDEINSLISKHFKNKKGEDFKNTQLNQTKQNILNSKSGKIKKPEIIESITNSVKNYSE